MLDQANSFYICAKLCESKVKKFEGRIDIYATPMIVNLSFACEVYIKTLLDYLGEREKRGHKLNELIDLLPYEMKKQIFEAVEEKYGTLINPFGIPLINTVSDAFQKWQPHEICNWDSYQARGQDHRQHGYARLFLSHLFFPILFFTTGLPYLLFPLASGNADTLFITRCFLIGIAGAAWKRNGR